MESAPVLSFQLEIIKLNHY